MIRFRLQAGSRITLQYYCSFNFGNFTFMIKQYQFFYPAQTFSILTSKFFKIFI
jgi:hypothetical protein